MLVRLIPLIVGVALIVPIVVWPGAWPARLAVLAVGLAIVAAWGQLWPLRRWSSGGLWHRSLEIVFTFVLLLLVLQGGSILVNVFGFGERGFPGALLEDRVFLALLVGTWLVVLVRATLRAESPPGAPQTPQSVAGEESPGQAEAEVRR